MKTNVSLQLLKSETRLSRLPEDSLQKLNRLLELLLAAQQGANLTAIKDPAAIIRLHFADSLYGLDADEHLQAARDAGDIGSGAGFPLLPLAIMAPDCHWRAIESVGKKTNFIESASLELGLKNVSALHMRAEEVGRSQLRGQLDAVTARAVGPIISLCEVGLPLLKHGGALLLYKTESSLAELEEGREVLARLGGESETLFRYRLSGDDQDRIIIKIRKISETPEVYPRLPGVPFNKPLR